METVTSQTVEPLMEQSPAVAELGREFADNLDTNLGNGLQAMEQSALGFGGEEQARDMADSLMKAAKSTQVRKDGVYLRGDQVSPDQYDELARYLKSTAMMFESPEIMQEWVEKDGNHLLSNSFMKAVPYEVNYKAMAYARARVSEIPGTEVYARKFETAGHEHVTPPAVLLSYEDLAEKGEIDRYRIVADSYFGQMDDQKLADAARRVDALKANDGNEFDASRVPECTVCIPVAAMSEPEEVLLQTLRTIASQDGAKNTEVIIYANYKLGDDFDPELLGEKEQMFKRLQGQIEDTGATAPRIRYVLEGYQPDEVSISKIRKDYMDMVAIDLHQRGAEYSHPVLWLDADTTNLSTGALREHMTTHRNNAAGISIASSDTRFTMSQATDVKGGESTAQKLAAYAEIGRRQSKSKKDYSEESGLSIKLGSYLLIGGVNEADPINESAWLRMNADIYGFCAERIFGKGRGVEFRKLPTARVYTSGRRQVSYAAAYLKHDEVPTDDYLYFRHDARDFTGEDEKVRRGEIDTSDEAELNERIIDRNIRAIERVHSTYRDNFQRRERAKKLIKLQ